MFLSKFRGGCIKAFREVLAMNCYSLYCYEGLQGGLYGSRQSLGSIKAFRELCVYVYL